MKRGMKASGRKINWRGVEEVKVDEFRYLRSEVSNDLMDGNECDRRIAAKLKRGQ